MVHELPLGFEVGALVFLLLLLLADLMIVGRRPHIPSMRESAAWVSFYVGLAIVFGIVVWAIGGAQPAGEFFTGWLTEYSLSVDNLFVFIVILASFAVPRDQQQRVLMAGIIIALVLRAGFILIGAAVIERFEWVFYLFGAFLIVTAIKLIGGHEDPEEYQENRLVRMLRRVLPLGTRYDGGKFRSIENGRRVWTPMVIVLIAIGSTDVLFAVDSIPAIFGLTKDPFLVFATNVFALMGLRQLYFLLGGLLQRLIYLPLGLALILGFIGVKLVLDALHGNTLPFVNGGEHIESVPTVPIWLSLTVIAGTLIIATLASLARTRRVHGPVRRSRPDAGKSAEADATQDAAADSPSDAVADSPSDAPFGSAVDARPEPEAGARRQNR